MYDFNDKDGYAVKCFKMETPFESSKDHLRVLLKCLTTSIFDSYSCMLHKSVLQNFISAVEIG